MVGVLSSALCPVNQLGLVRVRQGCARVDVDRYQQRQSMTGANSEFESGQEPETRARADGNQGRMGKIAGKKTKSQTTHTRYEKLLEFTMRWNEVIAQGEEGIPSL